MGSGATNVITKLAKPAVADDLFAPRPERTGVDIASGLVDIPLRYYRADAFLGVFSADLERVRDILPSPNLHPVTLRRGRAAVAVAAHNFLETSVGPYGEVGLAAFVTESPLAPPLLPLLAERVWPYGAYIHHLPVTSRPGRDAGRVIWNYPKFIADMAFEQLSGQQSVRLEEAGRHILTLTVRQAGLSMAYDRPVVSYSVKDRRLVRTTVAVRGTGQVSIGRRGGTLELGDHVIAQELRGLGLSSTPWLTKNLRGFQFVIPEGVDAGPARPYDGYRGEDKDFGRLTIRYSRADQPTALHCLNAAE